MDKSTYINRVINDHLSDTTTYQQLSDKNTHQKLDKLKDQLQHLFQNPSAAIQNTLQDIEHKYFDRSFKTTHYIPTFYGLVKIHKTPWTQRPVVSCCGSLLATVSTWIDFHLQRIRHNLPTFIKDSQEFQEELSKLKFQKIQKYSPVMQYQCTPTSILITV